jgi:hypothetical protein
MLFAEKRNLVYKHKNIDESTKYAKQYKEELRSDSDTIEANFQSSKCPFCQENSNVIINEANQLESAINWLNVELKKTPYLLDSFESDKNNIKNEILKKDREIKIIKAKIHNLENITKALESNKSLSEQTLKTKLKIENLLESLISIETKETEENIKNTKIDIKNFKKQLRDKFNVDKKIKEAESYINKEMKLIGNKFDFEESYKPISLKFALESFDLWHEKEKGNKVYLRSMGSGANWLYSHLTLFLAIHKFFAYRKEESLIPSILFLDQPTQVYFPTSIKDNEDKFSAKKIEDKKGDADSNLDDDIKAVTNIFNQLVLYCNDTLGEIGIEPQIIITDHVDKLDLDGVDFEDLVNGRRWRTRGFISDK